jgi:hypothetical protein
MAGNIELTCPCCATKLVVDAATGEILAEERPKIEHDRTFESALSDVQAGSSRRAEMFDKAFDRTRKLDDILEKKFAEAKKKAEKDPQGKPRGPFDLD